MKGVSTTTDLCTLLFRPVGLLGLHNLDFALGGVLGRGLALGLGLLRALDGISGKSTSRQGGTYLGRGMRLLRGGLGLRV